MCGIWAIINRCKLTPEKLASFEKVKPRGPDHSIIHLNASSIIGFHRLSINDLTSKGEQPFCHFNTEYKYTVIANGEIYNHLALRVELEAAGHRFRTRSDTEAILADAAAGQADEQAVEHGHAARPWGTRKSP